MSWHEAFDRVRLNSLVYTKKKCDGEKVESEFEQKLVEDMEFVLDTIYSDGEDAYPVEMSVEYLVHSSMWDMFEYYPRYLDRFLPGTLSSPFRGGSGEGGEAGSCAQKLPQLIHKIFRAVGENFNEREIYSIVMAEISTYRNSILLRDFLDMLRSAVAKIAHLKRDKFILDCVKTIAACLRCRETDSYTGVPPEWQTLPSVYELGKSEEDPELTFPLNKIDLGQVEGSDQVVEAVDVEAARKHLYSKENEDTLNIGIGSQEWIERATLLGVTGIRLFSARGRGEGERPSPFARRLSTKVRRGLTSILLVLFEPWVHVDFESKAVSRRHYNIMHELLGILVSHGMTFEEIFREKERFMPWTEEGIAKSKGANGGGSKHFFAEDENDEPSMESDSDSDDSEDEFGRKKRAYGLSDGGGATLAYLVTVAENAKTNAFAPRVHSPLYTFRLLVPSVRFLLLMDSGVARRKGFAVAKWLINSLPPMSIKCDDLEDIDQLRGESPSPTPDGAYLAFGEAMVTFTCATQDNKVRSESWSYVVKYLGLFSEDSSFYLLRALIQCCPYKNVIGLLFDVVLANVQRAWATVPDAPAGTEKARYYQMSTQLSLYAGPQLSVLLWDNLAKLDEGGFYDSVDVRCSIFNIFRFILLRDKGSDYCGLWPSLAKKTKERFKPLRIRVAEAIKTRAEDACAAKHKSVQKNMNLEVLRLNMLLDTLDRVLELIVSDSRYKLLA